MFKFKGLVMKFFFWILIPFLISSCEETGDSTPESETIEKVPGFTSYINGKIYTANQAAPWAEAVVVDQGVIAFVGTTADAKAYTEGTATEVDLQGLVMLPGIHDVHIHAIEAGINEDLCVFSRSASLADYESEFKTCAAQSTDSEWILGSGIAVGSLLGQAETARAFLDRLEPNKPVLILDDLGHGAFANSKALESVGYDKITSNPQGGIVYLDKATKKANGIMYENAQQALRSKAFPPTDANVAYYAAKLKSAMATLSEHGITSVSDAGGFWTQGHEKAWAKLAADDELTVRAYNSLYVYPDQDFDSQMKELKARFTDDSSSLLKFNQVKIYIDGILSLGTSFLKSNYTASFDLPEPLEKGFLYFDNTTLQKYVTQLEGHGFHMHFHTTGDQAATIALDAVEQARTANGDKNRRHRITHLYLVDQSDWGRFKSLNVIADFQIASGSITSDYEAFLKPYIGSRSSQLLPLKSLMDTGARVVISSDWDADELSPFAKIQVMLERGKETVTDVATIVDLMTIEPAYLLAHETMTGSIEVGKKADLIVIDRDIFTIEASKIGETEVLLTLLEGEAMHTSPNF